MAVATSPPPPEHAAHDQGPAILATCITLTIVSTIFVAARLFARTHIIGKLHIDDYLITLSLMCGWATVGITVKSVEYGNGRHFSTLTQEQMSGAIFWTVVGFCPGIMSFGLPKLAVAVLLTRLMNPARWHAIFIRSIAILCLLSLFGCVAIFFAQCTPTRAMWDYTVQGECWSPWVLVDYTLFAGSFSAFVDLYFAVYPAIVLFNLQMSLKRKIGLASALGLGSVATVIAIYKTTHLPALASPDFSYDSSDLTIWTTVEGSTITIAACIPVLKPLVDRILGRHMVSSRNYQQYGSSRGGHNHHGQIDLSKPSGGRSRNPKQRRDGAVLAVVGGELCTLDELEAGRGPTGKSNANDSQISILSKSLQEPPRCLSVGMIRTDIITVTTNTPSESGGETYPANRWE